MPLAENLPLPMRINRNWLSCRYRVQRRQAGGGRGSERFFLAERRLPVAAGPSGWTPIPLSLPGSARRRRPPLRAALGAPAALGAGRPMRTGHPQPKTRGAPGAPRYALKQRMEENSWSATVQESSVFMGIAVAPIVALIAGILIFFMPKLLNYIVALYLIIIGILGLIPGLMPGLTA